MVQLVIRLRRRRHDSPGGLGLALRRGLAWPLQKAGQLSHVVLSKALLLSCEVALEYMLALTYSPQASLSLSDCVFSTSASPVFTCGAVYCRARLPWSTCSLSRTSRR